jgi:serine carboxypeptidase-like clade I
MTKLLQPVVWTFSVGGTVLQLLLLLLLQSVNVEAAPLAELVESLPEWNAPLPTTMYSGYLNATDGCDTTVNGDYCYLHYWLCMAEEDEESDDDRPKIAAADKPVVLWLNGGPGSSSVLGLLQENGPLLMSANGVGLMRNPYAWTKVAHLLVLESPIGVGYSYCQAQEKDGGVCKNTDKFTASAACAALADFYAKFPELANNALFATGESYAGVYLPTLAYEILVYNANLPDDNGNDDDTTAVPIPLKGLAVGDPCTDNTAQKDSMDALWYGHKYGLVDDAVFDVLWNQCQVRLPSHRMNRARYRAQEQDQSLSFEEWMKSHWTTQTTTTDSAECDLALKKFLLSSSRALSQSWRNMYIDDYSLFAPVTDAEDEAMQRYMDRPDVRRALHVTDTPIATWPYPDAGFDYTKEFDACNEEADSTRDLSMIDFYRKLAPQLQGGIWIYNGDTDPCVSYEGTRTAVKRIGFAEVEGGGYRPWFYNHTATTMTVLQEKAVMFGPDLLLQDTGVQFGGEVVNYEYGLAFLTVHGSGHMVPQFRPQAALHMLRKLLVGEALSPLMPSNATLTSLSDDDFMEALDQWTLLAKSAPYVSRYGTTSAAALAEES